LPSPVHGPEILHARNRRVNMRQNGVGVACIEWLDGAKFRRLDDGHQKTPATTYRAGVFDAEQERRTYSASLAGLALSWPYFSRPMVSSRSSSVSRKSVWPSSSVSNSSNRRWVT